MIKLSNLPASIITTSNLLLLLLALSPEMAEGMKVTVDRAGNLISDTGNQVVPGGLDVAAANVRTHPTVPFHCKLEIDFFAGEVKKEPTKIEVNELINKFGYWVTNLFVTNVGDDVFYEYEINRKNYTATYDGSNDHFSLHFDSQAILSDDAADESTRMSNHEIVNLLNGADYASLVKDYVWKSEPREVNVFWHTHGLQLQCLRGRRPQQQPQNNGQQRRTLLLLRGGGGGGGLQQPTEEEEETAREIQ